MEDKAEEVIWSKTRTVNRWARSRFDIKGSKVKSIGECFGASEGRRGGRFYVLLVVSAER